MSFKKSSSKFKIFLNRYFPISKYLSLDPVAIDISPDAIRVLKLKESSEGITPVFYKEVNIEDKHNLGKVDAEESRKDSVVSVLKKLKASLRLKYVFASLPEQKTYIYKAKFPREALLDMVSAIRFNIQENVPLNVDEVNFDYKVIQYDERSIEVVVSVFPKSIVGHYTDLLKEAGLFPISFESESSSIARSIVKNGDARPYILIRLLKNQVNVSVVENEVVQFASKIEVSGEKISRSLEDEDTKILSQELNKTLIYWFTSKKDTSDPHKIENAIIVGKYALREGLVEYLENSLKIDVEVGDVWANCFSTDDYIPQMPRQESLDYSSAIGLAIKALRYE